MNNEVGAVQSERSAVRDGAFNWLGQLERVHCLAEDLVLELAARG